MAPTRNGIYMTGKKPIESMSTVNKNRLEFLFDGIFAIAMTILVLELKVPEISDRHSVTEMGNSLLHYGPSFLSYILSFSMLGMFWYSHNNYYRHFQQITKSIFSLTLLQLAAAAFFPFCAALLGRYPINRLSIVIYIGCVMVYLWSCLIQWLLAKRQSILAPELTSATYNKIRKGHLVGSIITTTMFLLYLSMALTS
jgi:uncharacterized membrane protein